MSPFLTFAICLSIAYLLYYGANIGKDLYATGKQLTSNEEVFEIEDVPVILPSFTYLESLGRSAYVYSIALPMRLLGSTLR